MLLFLDATIGLERVKSLPISKLESAGMLPRIDGVLPVPGIPFLAFLCNVTVSSRSPSDSALVF